MYGHNLKTAITYSVMKFVDEKKGDIIARYTKSGAWFLDVKIAIDFTDDQKLQLDEAFYKLKKVDIYKNLGLITKKGRQNKEKIKLSLNREMDNYYVKAFYLVETDDFQDEFMAFFEKLKKECGKLFYT